MKDNILNINLETETAPYVVEEKIGLVMEQKIGTTYIRSS